MNSEQLEIHQQQLDLESKTYEYLQIHQRMKNEELINSYLSVDKSNSIKIILYHFNEFMKFKGDEIVIEALSRSQEKPVQQIRKEYQWFIKSKKHNHQTILKLIHNLRFGIHFQYYINYYSVDAILDNKMKDYKKHVICIAFLQRCFTQKDLINFIKTYKKKSDQI